MRRSVLIIILCFLVSCQQNNPQLYADVAPLGHPSYDCGVIANFPDENLEAAVKKQLGVSSRDALTCEKLKTLTVLDASNKGIKDLTGLQNAWRLQNLNAQRNQITTIDVVSSLYQLQILDIGDNQVSDISPVTKITQLRELHLWKNQIKDISPVTKLTRLYTLKLWNNQVTDINALQNLKKLAFIDLSRNQIVDISPLANNAGLNDETQINLIRNKLDLNNAATASDISKLKGKGIQLRLDHQAPDAPTEPTEPIDPSVCSNPVNLPDASLRTAIQTELGITEAPTCADLLRLTKLEPTNAGITDLTGLQFATNLNKLRLTGNPVRNAAAIKDLPRLYTLLLDSTGISNLSGLRGGLQATTYLLLNNNNIEDITPIASLASVGTLNLSNNKLKAIPALNMPKGDNFNFSQNQIATFVSPINLINLTILNLSLNQLKSLPTLNSPNLTGLIIRNNQLSTLDSLKTLTKLDSVSASDNEFVDVSALSNLPDLTFVSLSNNAITSISSLETLTNLRIVILFDNLISDISPLARNRSFGSQVETFTFAGNCLDFQTPTTDDSLAVATLKERGIEIADSNFKQRLFDTPSPCPKEEPTPNPPIDPTPPSNPSVCSNPVNMPDASLRAAIQKELGISNAPTCADLLNLKRIDSRNGSIADLTGLQYSTNLTGLRLTGNPVRTITALRDLPKLYSLFLDNTGITDLSGLAGGLQSLTYLVISNNNIEDISAIASLPNVLTFEPKNNKITFVPALNMPKLQRLDLTNNAIRRIEQPINLQELHTLVLSDNDLETFPALRIPSLTGLDLVDNKLSAIDNVSSLVKLRSIDLSRNNFTDLSGLAESKLLVGVSADRNQITDISILEDLPLLQRVNLPYNLISDLSPLVNNQQYGFGENSFLALRISNNCLDFSTAETQASQDLRELESRGVPIFSLTFRQRLFDSPSPCPNTP